MLVVTGDWTDRAARVLRSGQADGLILNYARGYRERSLDFLQDWPLRRLEVLARTIKDIEPIYRMAATLEHLSLTTAPTTSVDCARLPTLVGLWVEAWQQIRESVCLAPGLRHLGVYGYGETDLLALADNAALQSITLKQAPRLERLLGIEGMVGLADVWVAGAHKLYDLASLASVATSLGSLRIDTCGGLATIDDIGALRRLSELWVANCGDIDSLHPIAGLSEVTVLYLYESTRIVNGDLEPLLGLRNLSDLRMMNRKHYKPEVAEVKRQLGLTV